MSDWPTRRTLWRDVGIGVVLSLSGLGLMDVWTSESSTSSMPFRYEAKGRRDPFEPLVKDGRVVRSVSSGPEVYGDQPILQGILWDSAGGSIALLNDGEYKTGDEVSGYQVVEIRRDAVVLASGGKRTVLQISFESPSSASSSKRHNGR